MKRRTALQKIFVATLIAVSIAVVSGSTVLSGPCQSSQPFSNSSTICTCNSTACDAFPTLPTVSVDQVISVTSDASGNRFAVDTLEWNATVHANDFTLTVNVDRPRQTIVGFGGAFTDAFVLQLKNLTTDARLKLLASYFDPVQGIGYTVGRVPVASCDFSAHVYSYDDVGNDSSLAHFALADEDLTGKIPAILDAQALSGGKLRLFASPWSAPGWMKMNQKMAGAAPLRTDAIDGINVSQIYANYWLKFFEAYAAQNVTFWGLTPENEPAVSADYNFRYQGMYYTPARMADFVVNYLAPTLKANDLTKNIKIMVWDHNRDIGWDEGNQTLGPIGDQYPWWPISLLSNRSDLLAVVDGVAVHWYGDNANNLHNLDDLHSAFPDKFMLYTEACAGWQDNTVAPGSWERADEYARSILDELNHWGTGWTDWNMALDPSGGPNWANNTVDAPIIVNAADKTFYKNPLFYATGQFSRFIRPGAVYVESEWSQAVGAPDNVRTASFIDPNQQNARITVFHNQDLGKAYSVVVRDSERDVPLRIILQPSSVTTLTWAKPTQPPITDVRPCARVPVPGADSHVCVCNSTYCDDVPRIVSLGAHEAVIIESSASGKRLQTQWTKLAQNGTVDPQVVQINVNVSNTRQTVFGFGGAFTDAAGYQWAHLSTNARANLLASYFGDKGSGYTTGRVPIASCDFSLRVYSYDDVARDYNLTGWALAEEDLNYKIPMILAAQKLNGGPLNLLASPWSAPGWMKNNSEMQQVGVLLKSLDGHDIPAVYSRYLYKFFEAYNQHGVSFWAMTPQNEADITGISYQAMWFSGKDEGLFMRDYLVPELRSHVLTKNLKMLALDFNINELPDYTDAIWSVGGNITDTVDGWSIHWYADGDGSSAHKLTDLHNKYNKQIIYTEACNDWLDHKVKLGDWGNGAAYTQSILNQFRNWGTGWIDWNLALDTVGGPNWVGNLVDSPVIVDAQNDQFFKQPMYYALAQFSAFVRPGAVYVDTSASQNVPSYLNWAVFVDPSKNNQRIAVLHNTDAVSPVNVQLRDATGWSLNVSLEPKSLTTVVWQDDQPFASNVTQTSSTTPSQNTGSTSPPKKKSASTESIVMALLLTAVAFLLNAGRNLH